MSRQFRTFSSNRDATNLKLGINPVCYCYSVLKDRFDLFKNGFFRIFFGLAFKTSDFGFNRGAQKKLPEAYCSTSRITLFCSDEE